MVEVADLYARRYKWLGGWLCLNFANTNARFLITGPDERFNGYGYLVSWAWQAGLFSEDEAKQLIQQAISRQEEASEIHRRALVLRETIYRVFSAQAHGNQPAPEDMAFLNRAIVDVMAHARIVQTAQGFAWGWADAPDALDRFLWPVVRSVADLLVGDELRRLRQCEGDHCGWLFLDQSKNQNRRWCETEICGNRARLRRHYQRSKHS